MEEEKVRALKANIQYMSNLMEMWDGKYPSNSEILNRLRWLSEEVLDIVKEQFVN